MRCSLLSILPAAVLLTSAGCQSPAPTSALAGSKPNIVFILADDLSYRDLSIYGQTKFTTPNLDQLALTGVRFSQAYVAAPECAPSRGTLMTGLHTGHAPIRENSSARGQDHLRLEDITIAEMLKEAGYATGFTGKWGIGLPGTPGTPDKQGFDYSFGYYDQGRAHSFFPHYLMENGKQVKLPENYGYDMERTYRYNRQRPAEIDPNDANRYDENGNHLPAGVKDPLKATYSETLIEQAAVRFVRENAGSPLFLYFATQLPHGPLVIDNLGELRLREDFPSMKQREWVAMVQRIDRFTGELVDLLKELGVYENTIILFASDNGYSMCGYFGRGNANANWPDDPFLRNKGPFRGGKFSVLEGGIRVPFFMHWPGKINPGVSSAPVWLVDLLPTLAELAGVEVEHSIDGVSLLPLLTGNEAAFPAGRALYWQKRNEQAVRLGPWKAYRSHPDEPPELYLIEDDIHGERNLAASYPDVVASIERIMSESTTEHEWYHDPGETEEDRARKRKRAADLGQLQQSTRGNSVVPADD
ncbi:MAG: arylsulfatase [bacterium]|nr:arylsulfatase [bacterium]